MTTDKFDIIIKNLINLARQKRIINITDFCNILKDDGVSFSIYGNKNEISNIYYYLGDISGDCIDEGLPIITTIIDFDGKLKPFYRLVQNDFDDIEEKDFLKKYPKDSALKLLETERAKIFAFDWANINFVDTTESDNSIDRIINDKNLSYHTKENMIEIASRETFPLNLKTQILKRAKDLCENTKCTNNKSFNKTDGDVYLEIHHIKHYADCKKEGINPHTLKNCVVLCANCHRKAHYGNNSEIDFKIQSLN